SMAFRPEILIEHKEERPETSSARQIVFRRDGAGTPERYRPSGRVNDDLRPEELQVIAEALNGVPLVRIELPPARGTPPPESHRRDLRAIRHRRDRLRRIVVVLRIDQAGVLDEAARDLPLELVLLCGPLLLGRGSHVLGGFRPIDMVGPDSLLGGSRPD